MAADLPPTLKTLAQSLRKLPGVGARNAERLSLAILRAPDAWPETLSEAILRARQNVRPCPRCGFYAEGGGDCVICEDTARDSSLLCIVETANDILPLERSGTYRGLYHCLGGKLSPLDGIGPEDLRIDALLDRVRTEQPRELILALGTDVEGETTSLYLLEQFRPLNVTTTRLAQGLPMGGSLDLADSLTLGRALEQRRPFQ